MLTQWVYIYICFKTLPKDIGIKNNIPIYTHTDNTTLYPEGQSQQTNGTLVTLPWAKASVLPPFSISSTAKISPLKNKMIST
jgi:hypothetical protein